MFVFSMSLVPPKVIAYNFGRNRALTNGIATQISTNESPGFKFQMLNGRCRGHGPNIYNIHYIDYNI